MENRINIVDYLKGLSIISVICAHCNVVINTSSVFANKSSLLLQNLGTIGVICFFVLSGFLFHYPEKNKLLFFKKKFSSIIIPWIISATCVYFYVHVRKPPISLDGWINFILGNGSYCYYLTVLMIFYAIFVLFPFSRKNVFLVFCELLTCISIFWYSGIGEINPYLNIFNWIGYFSLGIHISNQKDLFKKIGWNNSILFIFCILYAIILIFQLNNNSGGSYWGGINVFSCWIGAIVFVLISIRLEKNISIFSKIIKTAGLNSFAIYIWHMPIAGIVARIMNIGQLIIFTIFRPVIVLFIVLLLLYLVKIIFKKIRLCQMVRYIGLHL